MQSKKQAGKDKAGSKNNGCTVIDLIRHGEPEGGSKYRGQTDDPLSIAGWQQMWDALSSEAASWDVIVSSPLCRCLEFAQELNQQHNTSLIVEDRFMEIGFGEWEGKTKSEIDSKLLERFYQNPETYTPPGAEKLGKFYQRIIQAWDELLDKQRNKSVLIIAHAGVIRGIISHIEQREKARLFKIRVPYANVSRVEVDNQQRSPSSKLVALKFNFA